MISETYIVGTNTLGWEFYIKTFEAEDERKLENKLIDFEDGKPNMIIARVKSVDCVELI